MSDKKKAELDRRSFLKKIMVGTGLATSTPFDMFLTNMMINFLQKGTAHAAGLDAAFEDFKFIGLVMAGGAPRYYWDLPVQPNGNDTLIRNPMVVSRFSASGEAIYSTTKVGNFYMPHVWGANIPTSNNGSVPMSALAQNMLIMRGLDLQIDSHEIDRARQMAPVAGGISLTGLVADNAKTPIPAVGRNGGSEYYRGEKGISYVELGGNNPLTNATSVFSPLSSSMRSFDNGSVEQAMDEALRRMSAAGELSRFIPSTYVARMNAKKLMMRSFGNLQGTYNTLVSKYKGLISRSFAAAGPLNLAGVDDRAIPGSEAGPFRIAESEYFVGQDIRDLTDDRTSINNLAEGMAIAEYMILNGLSSSVNIESSSILQTLYQQAYNPKTKSTRTDARVNQTLDVHFTGSHTALILFSRYYRAISACLYELISQLKAAKLSYGESVFDRTVLAVTSEFNRIPRNDASGADHGWQGSNYTILSGMIDQFNVVGNVRTNVGNRGTWGLSGPLDELNGREAIIGNAASTVAALVEVKSPTPNDQSFVYKDKGKARLAIKSVKNVA